MLDITYIRDNLDAVKANCANRQVKADVDRVIALDDERKKLVSEAQGHQQRANEVARLTGKEKDPDAREALKAEGKALKERIVALEKQVKQVEADRDAALLTLPNMTHPDAPVGATPEDNKVIRTWGTPRKFDFPPKDHVALAEKLDLVDFE